MTNIDMEIEKASLLPDRWYIIMRSDEEGNFFMSAYDTTEETEDDEYICTGEVVLNGLMELVENDFERVGAAGMARMAFHDTKQKIVESLSEEDEEEFERKVSRFPDSNIVKVDFGKKQ
jgi:hypothetical protein|tara:strand:+ start:1526 stop:1882 length:357 start_codon:yes stop_codon:yes gene_type:complete